MTNTMPHGRTSDAHFSFTKLLVGELEKTAAFYASVAFMVIAAILSGLRGHPERVTASRS